MNMVSTDFLNENDVHVLNSFINKHVEVKLIKERMRIGFIQAIDPVSKSIILEESSNVRIIPGHAITSIKITDDTLLRLERKSILEDNEALEERKTKLLSWLKKNMLPAKLNEDTIEMGNVTILSPYTELDISSNSSVVVNQIRQLIESMPKDFVS